ncbi:asparagine synthetase B family protein [Aquabacter spiritensis]|uniref:asparagine synthase (glutamine-hydrolyzing) n=1 Tax=Aquabacter spiritensis TaxID=933073 RepID=A0A4R3M403_9HYPH|nr:asparagine synthetase B [Aquabacter spiritensis]TCT07536.1 asparagine synthase (glutamine-hydrolysing) [Aquabacter spiritensis]
MQRALAPYGSDRSGIWAEEEIAFGIGLSRLLPEDAFDRQPLAGAGGRFRLVADVRLDNRPELAAALGLSHLAVRQMADSDILLAAWEKWQEAALGHLVGDFAFAVWDRDRRCLHLVRDFLGQRPLFFSKVAGGFLFSSMAKGLHALPEIPAEPDLAVMRDYLALAPMRGPGWFFAHMERVEPGAIVTLHADGRIAAREWYDWARADLKLGSDADYIEAYLACFDRAVSDRLRTNGSCASHLSGGFDSSAVAATAAAQLAANGKRLTAYTHVPLAGAPLETPRNRFSDEWPLAHTVAEKYPNIDHVAVEAADRMIGGDLDNHFHYFEYPALNLCNLVWGREISRLAGRQRHAVLLTGAMGNMTISLSGLELPAQLFRSGRLIAWFKESLALTRTGHSLAGAFVWRTFCTMLPGRVVNALQSLRGNHPTTLDTFCGLKREVLHSTEFHAHLRALGYDHNFRPWSSSRAMARFVLRRTDLSGVETLGNLAAFGVDTRDPTSDRRLVELTQSMPASVFLRNGQMKWIYHQAFAERVPAQIRAERKKGYQAADWGERFRRAAPGLQETMKRAARHSTVAGLIETDDLLAAFERGLPEGVPDEAATSTYRLKLLRSLAVSHFLTKIDRGNMPLDEVA